MSARNENQRKRSAKAPKRRGEEVKVVNPVMTIPTKNVVNMTKKR